MLLKNDLVEYISAPFTSRSTVPRRGRAIGVQGDNRTFG